MESDIGFRIERLENQKEETEQELKEVEVTISKLEIVRDEIRNRDTRDVTDRGISQLEEQREFLEGSISEIDNSIEFVRNSCKGVKQ